MHCFNTLVPPLTHGTLAVGPSIPFPDDLLCCKEDVALYFGVKLTVRSLMGLMGSRSQMLKLTAYSTTPAVTRLFNLSLTSGRVPKEWKCAWFSLVPKVAGTTDFTQFRPISLLPVVSKILERHVQAYLLEWAFTESLISDDQWGFLCSSSTTRALVNTVDRWHRCLEKENEVCAVFLDLKKAFDRVPHPPLLDKLRALNINKSLCFTMVGKLSYPQISFCCRWREVICSCKCPLGCPCKVGSWATFVLALY